MPFKSDPTVTLLEDGYALYDLESLSLLYANPALETWFTPENESMSIEEIPVLNIKILRRRLEERGQHKLMWQFERATKQKGKPLAVEMSFRIVEWEEHSCIELHARDASGLTEKDALLQSHARMIENSNRELARKTKALDKSMLDLKHSYEELEVSKNRQLQQAYKAGIAENAISVLHNIGNAITPAIVNSESLQENTTKHQIMGYLDRVYELLVEKTSEAEESTEKELLPFLKLLMEQLGQQLQQEKTGIQEIYKQLQQISEIISYQRKYARLEVFEEDFEWDALIQDVLFLKEEELQEADIQVFQEVSKNLEKARGDKTKWFQLFLSLLQHSICNIKESADAQEESHEIRLQLTKLSEGKLQILIEDNGVGYSKEALKTAFSATSNKLYLDYSLHDCANFIRANEGKIQLSSEGSGKGCCVVVTLKHEL